MPSKSAIVAAVGSTAALTFTLVGGTTTSVHAQPTCRGQEATHVGEPGGVLLGTDGRDVMVTNGARHVKGRDGGDLICVTGNARSPFVYAGRGNDKVDATRAGRATVTTRLAAGNDVYIGHVGRDWVEVGAGDNRVSTRRGRDTVVVQRRQRVRGSLGRGADRVLAEDLKRWSRISGGKGRDTAWYQQDNRTTVRVRLDRGWIADAGRWVGRFWGFEDARVYAFDARVHGTGVRNRIELGACRAHAYGKGGNDVIEAIENDFLTSCSSRRMTFYGEPGDDRLRGWSGPDRLYGGRGIDSANGARGRDLCRAERKRNCER